MRIIGDLLGLGTIDVSASTEFSMIEEIFKSPKISENFNLEEQGKEISETRAAE